MYRWIRKWLFSLCLPAHCKILYILYLNVCINGHFASHKTALQIALSIFCGVHAHGLFEWFNTVREVTEDSAQRSSCDGNSSKEQSSVDKKR